MSGKGRKRDGYRKGIICSVKLWGVDAPDCMYVSRCDYRLFKKNGLGPAFVN